MDGDQAIAVRRRLVDAVIAWARLRSGHQLRVASSLRLGMSLSLNETFRISAPPDRVWAFLKDPAQVVTCLPGAELTETIDAQTYGGRVKVKVGPITAAYAGKATLTQVDDAARRMQIVAEGKESGGAGSARMTMTGSVTALPDGMSEVSVDASIDIAGRVMQFGRGLIESVNKQLFRQFAESVQAKLQAAHASEPSAPPPPPPQAGVGADAAATDPVSPAAPDTSSSPRTGSAADRAPVASSPPSASAAALPPPRSAPARAGAPIAQGEELRAFPLLWKVFVEWLKGLFGARR
jgi:carbon monoxide dehydrogenase subunit G